MQKIDLNLSSLASGGVQENFDMEVKKLLENVQDPNTDAEKPRKLVMTLTLQPDESRELIKLDSQIKLTMAPTKSVTTNLIAGLNQSGEVEAQELKSGAKGQMYFDEEATVRTDTGVPVEEIEAETKQDVIDLQKQKKA
ncbi:hypothetical protein J0J36_03090 [Lactococcus sp. LG1074]|uniref:hypothetical protein n=1 Tax=Lactococcus TaxID=1357 RepID=UPI001A8EBF65|nr:MULTISPECIES: hypothetical protein [Lactococcus]QSR02669.1 hypothetical protein J0J36_03090 [Lactococcus sp. LG1074]